GSIETGPSGSGCRTGKAEGYFLSEPVGRRSLADRSCLRYRLHAGSRSAGAVHGVAGAAAPIGRHAGSGRIRRLIRSIADRAATVPCCARAFLLSFWTKFPEPLIQTARNIDMPGRVQTQRRGDVESPSRRRTAVAAETGRSVTGDRIDRAQYAVE